MCHKNWHTKFVSLVLIVSLGAPHVWAQSVGDTSQPVPNVVDVEASAGPITPHSDAWAYGWSKALQILVPKLVAGMFLKEIGVEGRKKLWRKIILGLHKHMAPEEVELLATRYEARLARVAGFATWKIGADLGFFLANGEDPTRAFTAAGLIPYTIVQYLGYRMIAEKGIMDGLAKKLGQRMERARKGMPDHVFLKRFLSKWLYREYDDTAPNSPNVPLRKVLLKPFVMMTLAAAASWPAYDMGVLFAQSGEVNFAPYREFNYPLFLGFTLGGYFGYLWGYNILDHTYGVVVDRMLNPMKERAKQFYQSSIGPVVAPRVSSFLRNNWCGRMLGQIGGALRPGSDRASSLYRNARPFLLRQNLTFRDALATATGVVMAGVLTSKAAQWTSGGWKAAKNAYFGRYGHMDEGQVKQVTPPGESKPDTIRPAPVAPDLEKLFQELEQLRKDGNLSATTPMSRNERLIDGIAAFETLALIERGEMGEIEKIIQGYPEMRELARFADEVGIDLAGPTPMILAGEALERQSSQAAADGLAGISLDEMLPEDWELRVMEGVDEFLKEGVGDNG